MKETMKVLRLPSPCRKWAGSSDTLDGRGICSSVVWSLAALPVCGDGHIGECSYQSSGTEVMKRGRFQKRSHVRRAPGDVAWMWQTGLARPVPPRGRGIAGDGATATITIRSHPQSPIASAPICEHSLSALRLLEVQAVHEVTEDPIGISKERFPFLQCHTRAQSSTKLGASIS